jgi:hypothetical protein
MAHALATSTTVRRALTLGAASFAVVVAASCDDRTPSYSDCDFVVRSCQTVCDYWCDAWGCYPTCWNQCWDGCYKSPRPPPGVAPPAEGDAAVSAPPASSDGGPSTGGSGPLCQSCTSHEDCQTGALCILRGGPRPDASTSDAGAPSGTGFCSQACASSTECPEGFACTQIGASRQCLPTSGTCQ